MEWSGLVKGRAGDGDGDWEGEGRGEGEGSGNRSILDCSNMMTVLCVSCAKRRYFVKAYYRPFVGCFRLQQHDDGIACFMCETSVFC